MRFGAGPGSAGALSFGTSPVIYWDGIMPRLYRKRPVTVEAIQFTDENRVELLDWLIENKVNIIMKSAGIVIRTLEGDMLAELNDYVIRGIQGEFYPCKPDIFEATYESLGQ